MITSDLFSDEVISEDEIKKQGIKYTLRQYISLPGIVYIDCGIVMYGITNKHLFMTGYGHPIIDGVDSI